MAFNPFLSMGEPVASVAAEAINPFMMTTEVEPDDFAGDNPFAASNPFADFGEPEPAIADTVPMDIFATEVHVERPTDLELTVETAGTRALPPETASLLQAVTGHMEQTSHHLLGRLPATRPPSPARDSPSPPPARPPPPRPAPPPRPDHQHILSLYSTPAPTATPAPEPEPEPLDLMSDILPPMQIEPTSVHSEPSPVHSEPPPVHSEPPPVHSEPPPVHSEPPPVHSAPPPGLNEPFLVQSEPTLVHSEQFPLQSELPPMQSATPPVQKTPSPIQSISSPIPPPPVQRGPPPPVPPPPAVLRSVTSPPSVPVMTATTPVKETTPPLKPKSSPSVTASPVQAVEAPMDCSESHEKIQQSPERINDNESVSNPFADIENQYTTPFSMNETNSTNIFQISTPQSNNVFGVDTTSTFEPTNNMFYEATNVTTAPVLSANTDMWATSDEPMIQDPGFNITNVFGDSQQSPFYGLTNTTNMFRDTSNNTAFSTNNAFGDNVKADDSKDAFDAFSAKFDSTGVNHAPLGNDAWGSGGGGGSGFVEDSSGFEAEDFDPFLSMAAPQATPGPPPPPARHHRNQREDQDENFSLFIRPLEPRGDTAPPPALAPPPRPPALSDLTPDTADTADSTPRHRYETDPVSGETDEEGQVTPPTPLFDEDVSVPLEDFPRVKYTGPGWEMQLRQPNKKKITGQRFWKKIFVRLTYQGDNPVVQLLNSVTDKEPFQELPLQACYSVSDISTQQYDQFGKIFTVKLQYVFYKERPGVRPGQVTKAERITNKLSQFAAYAIQGDYQGVKEFGSDLRKLGLPVEHAPQVSQLFKIGSLNYEDMKQFSTAIEEALFRLPAHRDRALIYKMEEVQLTAVDELYVEQEADGSVIKQIARVRIFFLGFLCGMPDVEVGVNDLRRQGREVVGRHDIIPDVTEEWIRVEDHEVHATVSLQDFNDTQIIRFKPPDACYIELMRFRVRPPKNRELPLQLKATWCVTGNKVELRADVLVPGFASRSLGQVPCEDVSIRFPIPECWIYLFRVEKHFRYGSVKSAHRRTGKVKGIERFLGAVDTLQESLIEVTSGQAKYEHQHRAIVWRMPRLPKEGQGAYTSHNLVSRMALTSFDQIPAELAPHAYVEFTMPATQVSHTTIRSVSLQNHDNDPPEKYVRYLARHEYVVGIERVSGESAPLYAVVTRTSPPAAPRPPPLQEEPDSDSDSD